MSDDLGEPRPSELLQEESTIHAEPLMSASIQNSQSIMQSPSSSSTTAMPTTGHETVDLEAAQWVWLPSTAGGASCPCGGSHGEAISEYATLACFVLEFELTALDDVCVRIALSADSAYIAHLNGQVIGRGPALGDIRHRFYDVLVTADGLVLGVNRLAILVAHLVPGNPHKPLAVQSVRPAFIASGSVRNAVGRCLANLDTPGRWLCRETSAYQFHNHGNPFQEHNHGYVGYFDHFDANCAPPAWLTPGGDLSDWAPACAVDTVQESLPPPIPRIIPEMQSSRPLKFVEVFAPGGGELDQSWRNLLEGTASVEVPSHSSFEVYLRAERLTTSFPRLRVHGGRSARISLTYAEALRLPWRTPGAVMLGQERDLENLAVNMSAAMYASGWTYDRRGTIVGFEDTFVLDGKSHTLEPFHWRGFQYVALQIQTDDQPLIIDGVEHVFTSYPFAMKGRFTCDDQATERLWEPSWWTLRLCAHQTFIDCPYYEQLQYAGDTQITSLMAMQATGDARLSRQAIRQFAWSQHSDGLLEDRYPSCLPNMIPSYALHWIFMLWDYLLYTGDRVETQQHLGTMQRVLAWFHARSGASGLPERLPHWNFVDWCPDWHRGVPPGSNDGPSCVIACQYLHALRIAARIELECGSPARSAALEHVADQVCERVNQLFWSSERKLYLDQLHGPEVSIIANSWALIAGAADDERRAALAVSFPANPDLAPVSFFGTFFLLRALRVLDRYSLVHQVLEPWQTMADRGLSTWTEDETLWRSLCHAWSAFPLHECIAEFLGIRPLRPGFEEIEIAPQLGRLKSASGSCPTPRGPVSVEWTLQASIFKIDLKLPPRTVATLRLPNAESRRITNQSFTVRIPMMCREAALV